MSISPIFQRYAYSPNTPVTSPTNLVPLNNSNAINIFTGGDIQAYVNNITVGNLESVTWSVSVETVGNYVMGRRDALVYTTGKRVIVGSMVFTQYDRHAILQQVFQLEKQGIFTLGSLWQQSGLPLAGAELSAGTAPTYNTPGGVGLNGGIVPPDLYTTNAAGNTIYTPNTRGLSQAQFQANLTAMQIATAQLIGSQVINYTDQIPPFDLTLVGVNKLGASAHCTIFGLQVTQETTGFSMNDMGNQVAVSFTALGINQWTPTEDTTSSTASAAAAGFGSFTL